MVNNAGSRGEGGLTEGAGDGAASMDARVHVLSEVVGVAEVAVAVRAVEILVVAFIILVSVASVFGAECQVASLTIVRIGPVILLVHVVYRSS